MLHWAALPTMGGVEAHLEALVTALREAGEEVTFLAGTPGASTATFHRALQPGGSTSERDLSDLADVVALHDVLHMHNPQWHRPETVEALLGLLAQRAWIGGCVFSVHNLADDPRHDELLRRLPAPIVAHSTFVARVLRGVLPGVEVWVLPLVLPPDTEGFAAVAGRRHPPVVLQPTRLSKWKGSHISLTATLDLLEAGREFTFVHAGSDHLLWDHGLTEELLARAAPWRDRGMIEFAHYPPARSWAMIRAADLVVHPTTGVGTRGEPYSMSIAQAMLSDRPVVVTRSGNLPDLVDGYQPARVIEPDDVEGLRGAIDSFLAGEWPVDAPNIDRATSKLRAWHSAAVDRHRAIYRTSVAEVPTSALRERG